MHKRQGVFIIIAIIVSSFLMSYTDAFVKPDYAAKSVFKFILFLIIPMLYFAFNKGEIHSFRSLFGIKKETLVKSVALGAVVYVVIISGYFLTKGFIDYSNVADGLTKNHGVSEANFVYVSLYISLINSFLEEFFFRGFGYITLKNHINKRFAQVFSSGLFALYHTGMLAVMFELWVLPLLFAGLMLGGAVFNWLNEKSGSIYTSWAVHMFANFSINTVGFILFGIMR